VESYETDFVIAAHELGADGYMRCAQFGSRERFRCETSPETEAPEGVLLAAPSFQVRTAPPDHHGIPALVFAFEESTRMNVWKVKNRLGCACSAASRCAEK
jgi:hypothetical protein